MSDGEIEYNLRIGGAKGHFMFKNQQTTYRPPPCTCQRRVLFCVTCLYPPPPYVTCCWIVVGVEIEVQWIGLNIICVENIRNLR